MAELLAGTGVSFFGYGSDAQGLKGLLQVVGDKDLMEWSGLQHAEMTEEVSKILEEYCRDSGRLRAEFPKKMLSQAGFDVLGGLLQSNPDHRLTAAAALMMPWFHRRSFAACFTLPVS
jgi:cell division cycle 2-like protein